MLQNKEQISFDFNDFYKRYYRKTFLFAKSYVHDDWVAEDIASESLFVLWQNIRKHEIHHPLTFLFSIVKNKSIDYLRHELTRQEAMAEMSEVGLREINTRISTLEACDPEKIYSKEVNAIVESTLNTLPEKTREVFFMSRYQYLSKEEIAVSLGITTKGVEYHISKALKSLRITLKDYLYIFLFIYFFQ